MVYMKMLTEKGMYGHWAQKRTDHPNGSDAEAGMNIIMLGDTDWVRN